MKTITERNKKINDKNQLKPPNLKLCGSISICKHSFYCVLPTSHVDRSLLGCNCKREIADNKMERREKESERVYKKAEKVWEGRDNNKMTTMSKRQNKTKTINTV